MPPGSKQDATALAITRWSERHAFDLDQQTWAMLFEKYRSGDVLEAIKRTGATRDKRPERVYAALLLFLSRMEAERNPEWQDIAATCTRKQ